MVLNIIKIGKARTCLTRALYCGNYIFFLFLFLVKSQKAKSMWELPLLTQTTDFISRQRCQDSRSSLSVKVVCKNANLCPARLLCCIKVMWIREVISWSQTYSFLTGREASKPGAPEEGIRVCCAGLCIPLDNLANIWSCWTGRQQETQDSGPPTIVQVTNSITPWKWWTGDGSKNEREWGTKMALEEPCCAQFLPKWWTLSLRTQLPLARLLS